MMGTTSLIPENPWRAIGIAAATLLFQGVSFGLTNIVILGLHPAQVVFATTCAPLGSILAVPLLGMVYALLGKVRVDAQAAIVGVACMLGAVAQWSSVSVQTNTDTVPLGYISGLVFLASLWVSKT